jgi:FkbM family methyltransferase
MPFLKQFAARLPSRWQAELKRHHFRRQISKGVFTTDEPEGDILKDLIRPGDWVVDVGANVGHYTKCFSELVGPHGRVLAFEPMPETFMLLSANVQLFAHANVSLINAAVSDKVAVVGMSVPTLDTGLANYYQAHVTAVLERSAVSVLTLSLDSFCAHRPVALVKIDAEGHERYILAGMRKTIEASRPVLIVEMSSNEIMEELTYLGYVAERLPRSPNVVFIPQESTAMLQCERGQIMQHTP